MQQATLIISLITLLTAIISPIITQIIAQHGAYKLKTLELFAEEKINVYTNFISASGNYFADQSDEHAFELATALNQAVLFSSDKTENYLRAYYHYLLNFNLNNMDKFMEIQDKVISSMKEEINYYHRYYRNSK